MTMACRKAFIPLALMGIFSFCSYALDGMVLLNTGSSREAKGDLIMHYVQSGDRVKLETGGVRGANFSPDATQAAYGKDGTLYVINIDGTGRRAVTSCGVGFESCTWCSNGYIYWGQADSKLRRVKPDGTGKSEVYTFEQSILWPSVAQNGARAAWWAQFGTSPVAICYDFGSNTWWNKSGGCRCTISPDGSMVTKNRSGHRQSYIYQFEGKGHRDDAVILLINNPTYDGSPYCNMQRFSSLSNDHVVYTNERKFVCYVHNIRTDTPTLIGPGIASDYAPFVVGDKLPAPAIAPEGGTFTDAVEVTISHSVNGAEICYTLDGSDPAQSSTVYSGPVEVTATTTVKAKAFSGGEESFTAVQTYTRVTQTSKLTGITVDPVSANIAPGGEQQFAAAAVDQFGNEMDVTFAWSVDGGGLISSTGLFTAGTDEGGPYTVTVSVDGESVTGTAEVSVAPAALQVLAPAAGDAAALGDVLTVEWQWTGPDEYDGSVDVEITVDGGLSWYSIAPGGNSIGPASAGWGALDWTVDLLDGGTVSPISDAVQVRVADYGDPGLPGRSAVSGVFSIDSAGNLAAGTPVSRSTDRRWSIARSGPALAVSVIGAGPHRLAVSDMRGRAIVEYRGTSAAMYNCPLAGGTYVVRLHINGRVDRRRVVVAW
ncbi:MAG: hypothetical protein GF418_09190 [Chitinivibrionales bacterium]|nr:hypothetical protein [Chitinivibrionales bacterium]MBD3395782.1 hypothetical protein [Chitinivibrionales bacterium]